MVFCEGIFTRIILDFKEFFKDSQRYNRIFTRIILIIIFSRIIVDFSKTNFSKVLLKDNHIGAAGSVAKAVQMAKEYAPFVRKIEVEVENLDMVKEAVEAGADIIMLDNMSTEEMQEAIRIIDGRAETECSGNVTKENISRLTSLGVDYISSGALTHSAPILDISLKHLHAV